MPPALNLFFILKIQVSRTMKKAEPQKTTYNASTATNHFGSPMPPAAGLVAHAGRRWADPSSTERSNRYPLPAQEYRPR